MKRAFLLLATMALFGSACTNHNCAPPETVVYWTFVDAAGRSYTGCPGTAVTPTVSTIRIFVNNQVQYDDAGNSDFACSTYQNGAILPNTLAPGNYQLQVEGYDQNGTLLYLGQQNVNVVACNAQTFDVTLNAVQGPITVNLTGFSQCPTTSYVWYSLTDVTNPQQPVVYSFADGRNNPTDIRCTGAVLFDGVPFGNYRLDFVQIVVPSGNSNVPYTAVYQNCTPTAFQHNAADAVTVALQPATASCPNQ